MDFQGSRETSVGKDSQGLTEDSTSAAAAVSGTVVYLTPDANNVVVLPPDVSLEDLRVVGRDLVVIADDGTRYVIQDGAVDVPQLVVEGVEVPPLNLAALLVGNEPQPAAGATQSSGGNFADPVGPIQDAFDRGDLLPYTELAFPEPEEEEILPAVDNEPTVIVITPDNPVGAVNATAVVDEAGLAARPGEPEGTDEPANSEITSGIISYNSPDGTDAILINGVEVVSVGQQIAGEYGILTITSIADGAIGYSYELTDNTSGSDTVDIFEVTVVDTDGDTATANLTVTILDDAPIAEDDVDVVGGDAGPVATGNVITGASTITGAAGADTVGADDAHVSAVSGAGGSDSTFNESGQLEVTGQYGLLLIDADGNYEYTPFDNVPGGASDVFTYTLTDGDGSTAEATLTINHTDLFPIAGDNELVQLDDDALPGGNPGGIGDDPDSINLTGMLSGSGGNGTLTFALTDPTSLPATFEVASNDGITLVISQGGTNVLEVTVTDPTTGAYTVKQLAPIDHPEGEDENNLDFSIGYSVTDLDGDIATGTLDINVDDDTPVIEDPQQPFVPEVVLDESRVPTDGDGVHSVTVNFAVALGTASYGADGAGSTQYSLTLSGEGAGSGLYALGAGGAPGDEILLYTDGDDIVGKLGDVEYFRISVDADTGAVTFSRSENVWHSDASSDDDAAWLSAAEGTIGLKLTVTDADGDSVSSSVDLSDDVFAIEDDGPKASTASLDAQDKALVDESPAGEGGIASASFSVVDNFAAAAVYGTDGPGSIGGYALELSKDGIFSGLYALDADGGPDKGAAINLYTVGNTVVGRTSADGDDIFTISVDPNTGEVTFTRILNIWHSDAADDDDAEVLSVGGDEALLVTAIVTDADGDSAKAVLDLSDGVFAIEDDGPSGSVAQLDPNDVAVVDESALPGKGDGIASASFDVSDNFLATADFGSDGKGSIGGYALALSNEGIFSGLYALDADGGPDKGAAINLYTVGNTVVGRTSADGDDIFTISVDSDTGVVTFTQHANIWHSDAADADDAEVLSVEAGESLQVTATVTDADGDTAGASLDLSQGAFRIEDDGPRASDDVHSIASGQHGPVAGNVITDAEANGDNGADDPGTDGASIVGVAVGDTDAVLVDAGTVGTEIQGAYGKLTLNADGSYSYTRDANTPGGVKDVFTYTLQDGDGDAVTATLTIDIGNDTPVVGPNELVQLDDDAFPEGNPGGVGDDADGENTTGTLSGSGGDGALAFALTGTSPLPAGFTIASNNGTTLVIAQNGTDVLQVTITDAATGAYTVAQLAPIDHPAGGNENNLSFTVTYSVTDADGDSAPGTLDINVDDDSPISAISVAGLSLTHDETPGVDGDADDVAGTLPQFGSVSNPGNDGGVAGDVIGYAISSGAISSAGSSPGADGGTVVFSLDVSSAGVDSGLKTTEGHSIVLHKEGDLIVGRVVGGAQDGKAAFAIAVDSTSGKLSMVQYLSIKHPDGSDPDDVVSINTGAISAIVTVTDGDGDTSSSSAAIGNLIRFQDDAPSASTGQVRGIVDEDDLSTGNDDSAPGDDNPGGTTTGGAAGSLASLFTAGADEPLTYGLGEISGLPALTSNGAAVTYEINGNVLTASANNSPVFTLTVNSDGSWTFDLQGPLDHATGKEENNLHIDLSSIVTATDADGDSVTAAPGGLVINVDDDMPVAADDVYQAQVNVADYNIAFVLDFSGSIDNNELNTMLNAVKAAGQQIFNSPGNETITLVAFSSSAQDFGSFTDYASFLAAIKALNPAEGGTRPYSGSTNFSAAITELMASYTPDPNAINQVFFLSDGNPNQGTQDGHTLNNATRGPWQDFVNDHDIGVTSIGIGNGVSDGPLKDIDVDGSGEDPLRADDFDDLLDTLLGAVSTGAVTGNVLDNDEFGADGPAAGGGVSLVAGSLTGGGTLVLNPNGTFTYTPAPTDVGEVTFRYVITDADGDGVEATVRITIDDLPTVGGNAPVQLDDDAFGGNPGGTGDDPDAQNTTGILSGSGNDGPLTFELTDPTSLPAGFQVASNDGTTLIIKQGGTNVLEVKITDPATGAYKVTQLAPIDHPAGGDENNVVFTINYSVTDADGDSANGTLQIDVDDDTPVATGAKIVGKVDEDDLPAGLGDNAAGDDNPGNADGDNDGTTTGGAAGSLASLFSAGADGGLTFSLSSNTSGLPSLTSNGDAVTYNVSGNVLTASADGSTIFKLTVNADGSWKFDLEGPLDHAPGNNENNLDIDLSSVVTATDADGDSVKAAPGGLVINVDDDMPVAANDEYQAEINVADYNIAFVLDFSGSISNSELDDMLDAVKAAGEQIFNSPGNEKITLVAFSDGAESYGPFTDYASFLAKIEDLRDDRPFDGNTSFSDGINELLDHYDADPNAINQVFFLSDGNPNRDTGWSGEALNGPTSTRWSNFVNNKDVSVTAVGIGNGISNGPLQEIDIDGSGSPIRVDDFEDLLDALLGEVSTGAVTGNVLGNDDFGADGPGGVSLVENSLTGTGELVLNSNGTFTYTPAAGEGGEVTFQYKITDADGDSSIATVKIVIPESLLVVGSSDSDVPGETDDHTVPNPNGPKEGAIEGGDGPDVLVGDPGAVTIQAGQTANVVLVLDTSLSMNDTISFGGGRISRLQALKDGTNALIESLAESGAENVRITIVNFSTSAGNEGTFNLIVNGVVNDAAIAAAKVAVNGLRTTGYTNYEAAMMEAHDWIAAGAGIAGAHVNKVVFVSDGEPTAYVDNSGREQYTSSSSRAMDELLGSHSNDKVNDVQRVLEKGYTIDAIGIALGGNSSALRNLGDVEDGIANGGTGEALNVESAEDLAASLAVLGGSSQLAVAGNDTINGGNGVDIIFGDVLFTDDLAAQHGVNLPDGSGWSVFQTLENRSNNESADPAGDGADWTRADTLAYIKANHAQLAKESGREGGHDTINGGDGNDIIYGQEGNDTISGGAGDDFIVGGTGADVMTGGAGADRFVIFAGDARVTIGGSGSNGTISGYDTITDFSTADLDKLDLHGNAVVADSAGNANGSDSVLRVDGDRISHHSISNGMITFRSGSGASDDLTLTSEAHVAAAVDYLQRNDIGSSGATVAFRVGSDTYIYQQVGSRPDSDDDILVKLEGVQINDLSSLIGNHVVPIVMDLDGDGAEFAGLDAGVTYDYGHGLVATAWAGADDGILAFDANGDGKVSDASEFVFGGDGLTDLEGLALNYDTNGDGVLDASDEGFAQFGVWQDANLNGVADDGEFLTLEDLGITSIALTSDGVAYSAAGGDVKVAGTTIFTRSDGSTGSAADAAFATKNAARETEIAMLAAFGGVLTGVTQNGQQFMLLDTEIGSKAQPIVEQDSSLSMLAERDASESQENTVQIEAEQPADDGAANDQDFHSDDSEDQEIALQTLEVAEEPAADDAEEQAETFGGEQFLAFASNDDAAMMDALLSMVQGGAKDSGSQHDQAAAKEALEDVAAGEEVDQILEQLVGEEQSQGQSATGAETDAGALLATQLQDDTLQFHTFGMNDRADDDASLAAAQAA